MEQEGKTIHFCLELSKIQQSERSGEDCLNSVSVLIETFIQLDDLVSEKFRWELKFADDFGKIQEDSLV